MKLVLLVIDVQNEYFTGKPKVNKGKQQFTSGSFCFVKSGKIGN